MEVQHWTTRIPWWVKWATTAAFGIGGVVGASSVLPVGLQVAGLVTSGVLLLMAAIGTVGHFVNERRQQRGERPIKLEPIHVILIGLLITAAGVGWQWQRGNAASPPGPAAAPIQPVTAANVAPQLPPFPTPQDKTDFRHEIGMLLDLVNKKLGQLVTDTENNVGAHPLFSPNRSQPQPAGVLDRIKEIRERSDDISRRLFDSPGFFGDYPLHRVALQHLMPQDSQERWNTYRSYLLEFERVVRVAQKAQPHTDDPDLYQTAIESIDPIQRRLEIASGALRDLIQTINQRAELAIKAM
jgi:hypothetical protein